MDDKKLNYFFEVARLKSFTKAAENCFVSQTAVSNAISVLEEELQIELFVRDKKKVELTPAGKVFLEDSMRITEMYKNAEKHAQEVAKGYEGIIRIGYFSIFDRITLASALKKFMCQAPKVKVDVIQCSVYELQKKLLAGEIDIALVFRVENNAGNEIAGFNVRTQKASIGMNIRHPLADKKAISLDDLKKCKILTFNRNPIQNIYEYDSALKKVPLQLDNLIYIESIDTALLFLENSDYIMFMPDLSGYAGREIIFKESDIEFPAFESNVFYIRENRNPVVAQMLSYLKPEDKC